MRENKFASNKKPLAFDFASCMFHIYRSAVAANGSREYQNAEMRNRPAWARPMLTKSQRDLLAFITRYTDESEGMAPTFAEMGAAIGHPSKSHISKLVIQLEARGFIRRIPNRARAIEVLRRPEAAGSPVDQARANLRIAQRVLEDAAGAPFGATLALIAIKTAIEHLGPGKGEAT